MKYAIAIVVALLLITATACDKLKIPGNIAGQVLDQSGSPRGMVTVQLIDGTGKIVQQEVADDLGNYFFSKVDPGTYKIVTLWGRDEEMPNDTGGEVKLAPGKTINLNITVSDPVKKS
jgi:hypothetical protein